jgi:hypothetical protein
MYFRATVTRTAWYRHKNRYVNQTNGTEHPKTVKVEYTYLIIGKSPKNTHCRKDKFFNKQCWKNYFRVEDVI